MADRFFFLHMQKTAGTSLWQRLNEAFPREQLYPGEHDGQKPDVTILPEAAIAAVEARGDEIRVVTGHFPLCTTELLGGGFRTFTVLRHPVERTLSSLRHYREKTPGMEDVPLAELYEDPWRRLVIRNHMVKMLSLTVEEMTGGMLTEVDFTPARLQQAKDALDTIDVVGIQTRFEPFCDELARRFGWDLGPPRYANRTSRTEAPEDLVARIVEDQADDIALFEYGCSIAV
ncbi:MAG: hypothetical protein R8F63_16625 [Acidimicrobiales bacterium]|nr:hypothetical protein [Acidimicrobiales bacterium]